MDTIECIEESQGDVEQLVNAKTLAKALNLSEFTLWTLAREKKIPVYRCGRSVRFRLSEVLAWMKAGGK